MASKKYLKVGIKPDGKDIVWSKQIGGCRKVVVGRKGKRFFIRAPLPSFTNSTRVTRRISLKSLLAPERLPVAIKLAEDLANDLTNGMPDEELIAKWTGVRSTPKGFVSVSSDSLLSVPSAPGIFIVCKKFVRKVLYCAHSDDMWRKVTEEMGDLLETITNEEGGYSIEYKRIEDERERLFAVCGVISETHPDYQFRGHLSNDSGVY